VNIQNQLMEMPHITAGEEVKTNPKELWRMTQVPAYALDPKHIEKIWEVSKTLIKNDIEA
jgi:hypothetical protein